jgi:hypothetical protein
VAYVRRHPGKLFAKTAEQLPRFWYLSDGPVKSRTLMALEGPLLLLAVVGALSALRGRGRRASAVPTDVDSLLLVVIYFNVVYAATHVEARYSTPVIPYVIVLAVMGARVLLAAFRRAFRPGTSLSALS